MNVEPRMYVIGLLESYQKRSKQIELLHYELSHSTNVSENEMIDALALAHGESGGSPVGHISDKTLYIALNYQEQTHKANSAAKTEIATQLMELEGIQKRLTYYVSLLDARRAELLRLRYFEGRSQEGCAAALGITVRTVRRLREDAIDSLTEMYCYTEELTRAELS